LKRIQRYFGFSQKKRNNSPKRAMFQDHGTYHKEKVGRLYF
jgi:hypothetical protein